jgi:hypothetical protein
MLPALVGLTILALLAGGCAEHIQRVRAQSKSLDPEELDPAPGTMTERALRQALVLIGVFLAGSLVTALVYQWAKRKIFGPAPAAAA